MSVNSVIGDAAKGAGVGSMFGGAIGAGAGALIGAISSLFSSESDQSKEIKALIEKLKALQGYSKSEINSSVNNINRAGTTSVANAANTYALGASGRQNFLNAALPKAVAQVSLMGAERQAKMEDYNKNLEFQKITGQASLASGLDTDTPQQDFLSIAGLALQGLQIGSKFDQPSDYPEDPLKFAASTETMNNRFLEGSNGVGGFNSLGNPNVPSLANLFSKVPPVNTDWSWISKLGGK